MFRVACHNISCFFLKIISKISPIQALNRFNSFDLGNLSPGAHTVVLRLVEKVVVKECEKDTLPPCPDVLKNIEVREAQVNFQVR